MLVSCQVAKEKVFGEGIAKTSRDLFRSAGRLLPRRVQVKHPVHAEFVRDHSGSGGPERLLNSTTMRKYPKPGSELEHLEPNKLVADQAVALAGDFLQPLAIKDVDVASGIFNETGRLK